MAEKETGLLRDLWSAGCGWMVLAIALAAGCLVKRSHDEQERNRRILNGPVQPQ